MPAGGGEEEKGGRGEGDAEPGPGLMVARCISLTRFDFPNRDRHARFHEKGVLQRSWEQRISQTEKEDEIHEAVDSWLRPACGD